MSQGSVSRSQILPKTSRILLRMSRLPAWFECHGDVAPTDVSQTFLLGQYVPWTIRFLDNMSLGRHSLDNMSLERYASWTICPLDDTPLGKYVPRRIRPWIIMQVYSMNLCPDKHVPERLFLPEASLGQYVPWTIRTLDNKSPGRYAAWTICTLDNTSDAGLMCPRPKVLGCCAPWTKRPLDIVSLTDVSRPWTASSMELAPLAAIAASVGLRPQMDQWGVWPDRLRPWPGLLDWRPSVGCTLGPHIELHCFAALKRAAVGSRVSLRSIKSKGWDGSVRGKLAKGHFVQGMQHPRIFGWGHIGRGWTNIAPYIPWLCAPERCVRKRASLGRNAPWTWFEKDNF
jgi:hypothetical protein